MTTPWTTPTSFVNGVVIGATDLNTQLRDNMSHLKAPPLAIQVTAINSPQATTTATTAVPITAGVSASLTTYGAPVQVFFDIDVQGWQTVVRYNLEIDGTAYTDRSQGLKLPIHFWVTGLASGTHTFVPTWQTTGGTLGYSAATNASAKPIILWAREG